MKDLFSEYIADRAELMPFFSRPARTLFSEPLVASALDARLVEDLNAYQKHIGGSGRIAGHETVIVTGQQPALFAGPLYTLYKAVTAVSLAEKVRCVHGAACVPVFWVSGEDHDFEEARSTHILTKNHTDLTLTYAPRQDVGGMPLYRVGLEASLHGLVDQAAAQAPGSEFRDEVASFLHESLDAADSFSGWSARILARLFRDTPLVFHSPTLPAARMLAAEVFAREVRDPVSSNLVNVAGEQLVALGYVRQVAKADHECGFFLDADGRRCKVVLENGRYILPENGQTYSIDGMLDVLERAPERFSPNVALRCIVQQRLFSPLAYVAGPGEVAYWAQLKHLFEHYSQPMPVVYPRARGVVTTAKLKKLMARFGFQMADLDRPLDDLIVQALRGTSSNPVYGIIHDRRGVVEKELRALEEAVAAHDTSTQEMVARVRETLAGSLDRVERTVLQREEDKVAVVRAQVERLRTALMPHRKPQERVYSVFSFLFEQGWGFIPRLLRDLDVESFEMNEVEV